MTGIRHFVVQIKTAWKSILTDSQECTNLVATCWECFVSSFHGCTVCTLTRDWRHWRQRVEISLSTIVWNWCTPDGLLSPCVSRRYNICTPRFGNFFYPSDEGRWRGSQKVDADFWNCDGTRILDGFQNPYQIETKKISFAALWNILLFFFITCEAQWLVEDRVFFVFFLVSMNMYPICVLFCWSSNSREVRIVNCCCPWGVCSQSYFFSPLNRAQGEEACS